jgi:hypothetical protein
VSSLMSIRGLDIARPAGPRVPFVRRLVLEVEESALPGRRGGTSDASGALSESESESGSDSVVSGLAALESSCDAGFEHIEESRTCRVFCFTAVKGSASVVLDTPGTNQEENIP